MSASAIHSATFSTPRSDRPQMSLTDGTVQLPPIEQHALAAASRAHERLASRRTTGALVLTA